MPEASAKPAARILKGLIQLKESLVLRTVASVPFLAPWRMVAAELDPRPTSGGKRRRSAESVHDGGVGVMGYCGGGTTDEAVRCVVAVEGDGKSCAVVRRVVPGRRGRGLGFKEGGRRWIGGGLAVGVVRRPNP